MPHFEDQVREEIQRAGPREAFRLLIAQNDALIRRPQLDNGREITSARCAIYTGVMSHWAAEQQQAAGYNRPFAVVALGGTGRGEMTPVSDSDFAFLFDDVIEGNAFLLKLQGLLLHSDAFEKTCGFSCAPLPFNLDDIARLDGKQLNAFLDLRPVYDPQGLAGQFRARIRATFDPFEHFLHVQSFWRKQWKKSAGDCERLDRFDLKNEGLRIFLAGIWTLGGKTFVHSHDIYRQLEDLRDLQAYEFLLRIRAFVHSRKTRSERASMTGDHNEDIMLFDDFSSFGELLGPEASEKDRFEFTNVVRARLLSARRRVARFANGVIGSELQDGRAVSPGAAIVYQVGGLRHTTAHTETAPYDRSRAALSLLLAAQHYEVPIDSSELDGTFRNAGDWLVPVPELSELFYEPRGSLADSFEFLSQLDGAEDRLFPGYARFEASFDGRVLVEGTYLRGAFVNQKLRALEEFQREGQATLSGPMPPADSADLNRSISIPIETALLDEDHLAAVKLALETKRLPLTGDDQRLREDETRPLHERFSTGFSGVSLEKYYAHLDGCEFTAETLEVTRFLLANRREFKERAETGLNDLRQVRELVALCGTEARLRALFVFTCADRAVWESAEENPTRWFNTRELYIKTRQQFGPGIDRARLLATAGYSQDELNILKDFGEDFFAGVYRQYANSFGSHLVRLAQDPSFSKPKASILREGASTILGVAARDYTGLAASISGAFWHAGIGLSQAHLFSSLNHGLALDFFHLVAGEKPSSQEPARLIEEAIRERRYVAAADEAKLPPIAGPAALEEWSPGLYRLRVETTGEVGAVIYALTYKVFRHLGGSVFALAAQTARNSRRKPLTPSDSAPNELWVSVYHSLPPGRSLEEARRVVRERF